MPSERGGGARRLCRVSPPPRQEQGAGPERPLHDRAPAEEQFSMTRLVAAHPAPCIRHAATHDCEPETLAAREGVTASRFAPRPAPRVSDDSSVIIHVDHSACILCDRCIRACSDIKENFVIGRTGKGPEAGIAFDLDQPMADSSCVSCGECMVSCPTGALTNKLVHDVELPVGTSLD